MPAQVPPPIATPKPPRAILTDLPREAFGPLRGSGARMLHLRHYHQSQQSRYHDRLDYHLLAELPNLLFWTSQITGRLQNGYRALVLALRKPYLAKPMIIRINPRASRKSCSRRCKFHIGAVSTRLCETSEDRNCSSYTIGYQRKPPAGASLSSH